MKFLLTGSSGFIGKRLLNAIDENIVLLSRQKNSLYPTIICDFEKDEIPSDVFKSVDIVIHLAGVSHDFGDATKKEEYYRKINIDTTVRLASLAAYHNVKRFVFISSVKAGGEPISGRCRMESEQDIPEGTYGKTKREAELKILEISKNSDMCVSIIRPSLVYGPNLKGNLKLMFLGINKGWFPPLPETNNKRSMIHVDDLVVAILLAAQDERTNGKIFVATDGKCYSSREIYETMCTILGKSIPKWSIPEFIFDLARKISPTIKYKIDKLIGDECYSSSELDILNFKPQKRLKDMNETSF